MLLKHIGLVCSSEKNSDNFYKNILGLKKMHSRAVPRTLAQQIFNLDVEYTIINYANDKIHFEIFVDAQKCFDNQKVEHVCIEVDNLQRFLNKCRDMGVEILQIPRGPAFLTFIRDYDGNLFEIKAQLTDGPSSA
jgi:catechol 2,3-dioxygenase-like lactoylglutathione lyase family enzyme